MESFACLGWFWHPFRNANERKSGQHEVEMALGSFEHDDRCDNVSPARRRAFVREADVGGDGCPSSDLGSNPQNQTGVAPLQIL